VGRVLVGRGRSRNPRDGRRVSGCDAPVERYAVIDLSLEHRSIRRSQGRQNLAKMEYFNENLEFFVQDCRCTENT
jgi:hypothetical protein